MASWFWIAAWAIWTAEIVYTWGTEHGASYRGRTGVPLLPMHFGGVLFMAAKPVQGTSPVWDVVVVVGVALIGTAWMVGLWRYTEDWW